MITEIGGTVGDIESLPFLEAARQVRHEVGRDNVLLPARARWCRTWRRRASSRPSPRSTRSRRCAASASRPDALILRCDRDVPEPLKNKIALMCDVDIDGVISTPDAPSIYDIPKVLHREELDAYVVRRLNLPFRDVDWTAVERPAAARARAAGDRADRFGGQVHRPLRRLPVGGRGAAGGRLQAPRQGRDALGGLRRLRDRRRRGGGAQRRRTAVLIPGGFGIRGIEGKIGAIRYARKRGLPVLGLCLGLQCIVIEAARSVGIAEANSAEFDPDTPDPVISTMADQRDAVAGEADLGGTMRLGAYPAVLEPDSIVAQAYQATEVSERHRHRYEVNNDYRDRIAESGLRFSGTSPDGHLVEFVEYAPDVHPFLVGTQAHPELKSRPTRPHPLFVGVHRRRAGLQGRRAAAGRDPRAPGERSRASGHAGQLSKRLRKSEAVAEHDFETVASETLYVGKIFALRADEVRMPGGSTARREVVEHYGAVAIVALDDDDNVVLVYQYRHPVGRRLWELPAGLLDIGGEPPHVTAARELEEEAGLAAAELAGARRRRSARRGSATRACGCTSRPALTDVGRPDAHDEEADLMVRVVPAGRGGADGARAARSSIPLR